MKFSYKKNLIIILLFCMFYSAYSNAMRSSQDNDRVEHIGESTIIHPNDNSPLWFFASSTCAVISLALIVYAKIQQNRLIKKIESKRHIGSKRYIGKRQPEESDAEIKKNLDDYDSYYYGSVALAVLCVVFGICALVEKNNSKKTLVEMNGEGIRAQNKFISWDNLVDIIDSFTYIHSTRTQTYRLSNGQTATTEVPISIPVATVELMSRVDRSGKFRCELVDNDISIKLSDLPISKTEFIEIIKTYQQPR